MVSSWRHFDIHAIALAIGLFTNQHALAGAAERPTLLPHAKIALRIAAEGKVAFSGITNTDSAGVGVGSMVYPAFGFAGFLAAVVAHGVINEASKNSQRAKFQEAADSVLLPYRGTLDKFLYSELLQRTASELGATREYKLVAPTESVQGDWLVDLAPVFQLTQDQSALVLEAMVAIYPPGHQDPSIPMHTISVKVVSPTTTGDNFAEIWTENDSVRFKTVSARLVAESIEMALSAWSSHAVKEAEVSHKTARYRVGSTEKIERGQVMAESCERVLIRNLRGSLISAPPSAKFLKDSRCPELTSKF